MHTRKVFVDTNVWFSFFYGSVNSEKVIKGHVNGKLEAVISKHVLNELVKNIIKKAPRLEEELLKFFESTPPEIVDFPESIEKDVKKLVDFKDRHIFQACVNAGCDMFVTGNLKDFNVQGIYKKYKVMVISPREMANLLDTPLK